MHKIQLTRGHWVHWSDNCTVHQLTVNGPIVQEVRWLSTVHGWLYSTTDSQFSKKKLRVFNFFLQRKIQSQAQQKTFLCVFSPDEIRWMQMEFSHLSTSIWQFGNLTFQNKGSSRVLFTHRIGNPKKKIFKKVPFSHPFSHPYRRKKNNSGPPIWPSL